MILKLRLLNVALIKSVEVDFYQGLNVLSGETGAGKTVVISSLNFALGGKSDKTMIRNGEDFCMAEVVFDVSKNEEAKSLLNDFSIDYEDNLLIIKRKLTIDGKSDIKVNGNTITLTMLKQLTATLCDVYGQSEHYSLLQESNQLKLLDKFAGEKVNKIKEEIKPIILEIKDLKNRLQEFGGSKKDREYKLDLLEYQIGEIEKCNLKENEFEELTEKRKILLNIEKIGENLSAVKSLFGDNEGALDLLSTAVSKLSQLSSINQDYETLFGRLENLSIESSDIYSEVSNYLDNLEFDESEYKYIENRLDQIKNLMKKYGSTKTEIDEFYNSAIVERDNLLNFESVYNETTLKIENNTVKLIKLYKELSKLRKEASVIFSKSIENELKTLGMNSAKFEVAIFELDENVLSYNGIDKIEFNFSANSGEPLKTMSKIISGGEMSRFMLAMKIVCSEDNSSYIFDEIDAGISGEIAKIVAQKFAILSKKTQIITISHLPQIVSYSDTAYKILKEEVDLKTQTKILCLDESGKINEVVRLIGGDVSDSSINHAKQLISIATEFKSAIN